MIKKYKPFIISFYVVAVIAMIFAAFYDLSLDKMLNNTSNSFAIWLQNTGEIPSRLVCPLAGAVLFYTVKNKFAKLASLFIELGGSAYLGYYFGKYFFVDDENRMAFSIIYGLGVGVIILFAGNYIKVEPKYIDALKTIALISVIVMFVQIGLIEVMKYLWGRVRFRDLLASGNFEAFTPWYVLNGINGNKSFPSGHTAGASMSYLLMFIPFVSDKLKNKTALCFTLPCVYTSLVAFTRLVMGAHYLSDVTMGGTVGFTIVIIALAVYQKHFNNKILNK